MKRKIAIGIFLLVFGIGIVPVSAHAQNDSNADLDDRKQVIEERAQKRLERLETKNARRCEQIKTRLEAQRDKGVEIRDHRQKRYLHIVDRLNNLAVRLENDGINATQLRASIQQLSDLIAVYSSSFTEFENELQEAINSSCDETGVVKENVKDARGKLVVLKSNADDIHTFFQDQLKPLLQSIKEQVKQLRASTESDESEEQEEPTEPATDNNESTNEE